MLISHILDLLRHYRRLIVATWVFIVGGVAGFSVLFLFVIPLYTATAKITLLPTQSELAFSNQFVRSTTINPANLLTQTHIEYLLSFETSEETVQRIIEQFPPESRPEPTGLKAAFRDGFIAFRSGVWRVYNTLNSGRHVEVDPMTDAILGLQDGIKVEMVEGTYILEISVTMDHPKGAAVAANLLAEVYVDRLRDEALAAADRMEEELRAQLSAPGGDYTQIEDQIRALQLTRSANLDTLRVIDPAVEPVYPSFPKVVVNTIFAIVGAIFATAFILVVGDTFSSRIKTNADLARVMGAKALGSVRLRGGRLKPGWRKGLVAFRRRMNLQADPDPAHGAVIAAGTSADAAEAKTLIDAVVAPAAAEAASVSPRNAGSAARTPEAAEEVHTAGRETPRWMVVNEDGSGGDAPRGTVRNLGGAAEGLRLCEGERPRWMVLAMRPGELTETELAAMVDDWKARGTEHVFGLILKP